MSDLFDGMVEGMSGIADTISGGPQLREEDAKKRADAAAKSADENRRSEQVKLLTSTPGRRGAILTGAERVGSGVDVPQTPYPFVME